MIQIKNLNKYYNKGKRNQLHVIHDTTLELPDTGIVCILGESGSGKTTLLNTIGGLDDFESGEISFDGDRLRRYSARRMDRLRTAHCAYIFQNYYLLQDRTVNDNILLALEMYELSEQEKKERVDTVLSAVDMLKYKKRKVGRLSGGQQQRIAIARALAKAPKVIFADEPTGNLDTVNTVRIMRILKKASESCLVVMVTHEKRLAESFADRIIYVSNGKVTDDRQSVHKEGDLYYDDTTLYLQEYQEKIFTNDHVTVHSYDKGTETPGLELRIIYDFGKYYIQAPEDASVTFVSAEGGECRILDTDRPTLVQEDADTACQLEPLQYHRQPRLSLKEILHLAAGNLALLGKQQVVLIVSFLMMAVLLVLTAADFLTLNAIDIRSVVRTDSRYLAIEVKKNDGFNSTLYNTYFNEMLDDFLQQFSVSDMRFDFKTDLTYVYDGFIQIKDVKGLVSGYSLAPLDQLDESTLIAGRMPEEVNEIVVDEWVLENFLQKDNTLAQVFSSVTDMLGKELRISRKSWTLKIVGICDSGQPDIYMDKYTRLGITTWMSDLPASLDTLRQAFPETYGDMTLAEDEILISQRLYDKLTMHEDGTTYETPVGKVYQVVGVYPNDFFADFVVAEEGYDELLLHLIRYAKNWIICTEDKGAVYSYFAGLDEETQSHLQFLITDSYAEELSTYQAARQVRVNARLIVTVTIVLVSLGLLYFSMRSNAIKRLPDISVYRLLGVKRSSIVLIFALEILFLTSCTSLPAVLLSSGILKWVASVPALEIQLVYPWVGMWTVLGGIYLVNLIIGILPLAGILRLPPAQLAAKYDL